jgi:hypothetical protein
MAIPKQIDRSMAAIDDAHGLVMIKLRTMHCGGAPRDARAQLRAALQEYAELVMRSAPDAQTA